MNKLVLLLVVLLATSAVVSAKKGHRTLRKKTKAAALLQVNAKAKWVESGFDQETITDNDADANSPEHHDAMIQGQEESEYDARDVLDAAAKKGRKLIDDAINHAREHQGVVQLHFQMPKPAEAEEAAGEEESAEAPALIEKKAHKHKKHHHKHKEPTLASVDVAEDHAEKYASTAAQATETMTMDNADMNSAVKVINEAHEKHKAQIATMEKLCSEGACPDAAAAAEAKKAEEAAEAEAAPAAVSEAAPAAVSEAAPAAVEEAAPAASEEEAAPAAEEAIAEEVPAATEEAAVTEA